jgi:capsular polysaccharide biosynthesis protein
MPFAPRGSAITTTTRLLEPFTVTRPEPANLRAEDEHFFRHEYERSFGPTDLYELRDVYLTAQGVFIKGLGVVPELLYIPGETVGLRYVARNLLRRRARFDGPGERFFTAFNRWSAGNYFHWMCDVLPRVYLARSDVEGSTVVLPSSHQVPFVERSLAPFQPKRIAYFAPNEVALFRDVTVPGHIAVTGNYHEPTMRELARFLSDSFGTNGRTGRLVYVTRRRARHRYVVNEDDVIALVQRYGFEVVENEGLSLEQQVALYSSAGAYIGLIGANLTNIMFMRPGSAVLQLTRRGDASNHLYYALAAATGVTFYYQHCDHVEAGYGDRWNVTVDLAELRMNIEQIIGGAR